MRIVADLMWSSGSMIRKVFEDLSGLQNGNFDFESVFVPRYFVSPVMIVGLCLFGWINYQPLKYGNTPYPVWAHGVGWLIACTSLACIPIFAVIAGKSEKGESKIQR